MSLLEQVALAGLSFGHALRESRRFAVLAPWLLVFGAGLIALAALAWCAHPLLSWFMAPLLRASSGEDALRYPGLYHRMPQILADLAFLLRLLVVPVAFGGSAIAFGARYRGLEPRAGDVMHDALRLAPVFLLAALPAWLAELGLRAGLAALAGVRLSGMTRALLPPAGGFALVLVQALLYYNVTHAALARRGPLAALASPVASCRDGFVPALLVIVALGVPFAVLDRLASSGPLASFMGRVPETALVFGVVRLGFEALAGVLAAGTASLVWMGALQPREDA